MKTLYTEKQTDVAAFLGGPVPAGILMYKNFIRLGKEKEAYITIALTLIFTVSFGFMLLKLPDEIINKIPNALFAAIYAVIVAVLYRSFLAEDVKAQIAEGAKKASNWSVAGFSLLGFIINLIIIFGIAYLEPPFPGEKLSFGSANNEIYYNPDSISKTEVQQLGEELYALGIFTDDVPNVIQFTKGKEYALTFTVEEGILGDNEIATELKALTWSLEDIFDKPFMIVLENYDLQGKRKIKIIKN